MVHSPSSSSPRPLPPPSHIQSTTSLTVSTCLPNSTSALSAPVIMTTNATYPSNSTWAPLPIDAASYSASTMSSEYGTYPYVSPPHGVSLPPLGSPHAHHLPPPHAHTSPHAHSHAHPHSHHQLPPPHPSTSGLPGVNGVPMWTTMVPGNGYDPTTTGGLHDRPIIKTVRHTASGPRRMLTDEDRRQMCLFQLENPTMKQSQVGDRFGVERSTVSKVLGKRNKYLTPEELERAPLIKTRNATRAPDFERSFLTWVRRREAQGYPLTDADLIEHYRMLTYGNASNSNDPIPYSWLNKFKQRHNILLSPDSRSLRRMSIPSIADSGLPIDPAVQAHSPMRHSQQQQSPLTEYPVSYPTAPYCDTSVSSSSIPSTYQSDRSAHPSFSGSAITPDGNFTFSGDTTTAVSGGYMASDDSRYHQRPRSQAYPMLDMEYSAAPTNMSLSAPVPTNSSPPHNIASIYQPQAPMDTPVVPVSSQSLQRPHTPNSASASMPLERKPSLDEARRGLETAIAYVEGGPHNVDGMNMAVRFFSESGLAPRVSTGMTEQVAMQYETPVEAIPEALISNDLPAVPPSQMKVE